MRLTEGNANAKRVDFCHRWQLVFRNRGQSVQLCSRFGENANGRRFGNEVAQAIQLSGACLSVMAVRHRADHFQAKGCFKILKSVVGDDQRPTLKGAQGLQGPGLGL